MSVSKRIPRMLASHCSTASHIPDTNAWLGAGCDLYDGRGPGPGADSGVGEGSGVYVGCGVNVGSAVGGTVGVGYGVEVG